MHVNKTHTHTDLDLCCIREHTRLWSWTGSCFYTPPIHNKENEHAYKHPCPVQSDWTPYCKLVMQFIQTQVTHRSPVPSWHANRSPSEQALSIPVTWSIMPQSSPSPLNARWSLSPRHNVSACSLSDKRLSSSLLWSVYCLAIKLVTPHIKTVAIYWAADCITDHFVFRRNTCLFSLSLPLSLSLSLRLSFSLSLSKWFPLLYYHIDNRAFVFRKESQLLM